MSPGSGLSVGAHHYIERRLLKKLHFPGHSASGSAPAHGTQLARWGPVERTSPQFTRVDQFLGSLEPGMVPEQLQAMPPDVLADALGPTPAEAPAGAEPGLKTFNIMVVGFVAAMLILSVQPVSFMLQIFGTLVHEMGHAAAGWLYGYPSIPALDFTYGGGVTIHEERNLLLRALMYVGLAGFAYAYRANRLTLGLIGAVTLVHAATASVRTHEMLILGAGHGCELLMATVFLYRALTGSACRFAAERPLYACVGFFLLVFDVQFAFRLLTSPVHRAMYESAKGGGHWMDFSRVADEFLHVDLRAVAAVYLAACGIAFLGAVLAFAHRDSLRALLERVRDRSPGTLAPDAVA